MISTGVTGLDELLGKGIPQGSRVLFSLEPGVDGQLFMISSLSCSLKNGLSCLVILPNATVDAFRNDAIFRFGARLDMTKAGPIIFLDAIDRERIQKSAKTPEAQAREWQARVRKICQENKVDVIFAYLDLLNEDFGLATALKILEAGRTSDKTSLIIEHLNLEGPKLIDRFISEFAFDLVMAIRSSDRPIPHFTYFTLVHSSWNASVARSVPFIISDGRIIPYIPKILVTGPAQSGKSTFVANATEGCRPVDRTGQERDPVSEVMDYGWLRWRDFDITLHGTPGPAEYDPLIPPALKHAMGVVLIIDATKPDTFPRARHLIGMISKKKVPFVIAANKNDLPGSIAAGKIRNDLGIPNTIPVYPIAATRPADVHQVLEALVDYITQYTP
jgi:signal recognition particle receptor subunit beta